jgi:hypothetical protein
MRWTAAPSLALVIVAACAHPSNASSELFRTPARFVGQTVKVCGYMNDSSNIVESDDRDDVKHSSGLSIEENGPLNLRHRGPVCVEGEITYRGCGTAHVICIDAAYEYGIRVRRVAG